MSTISKSELSQLLGDEELGEQAYRLDILSRWSSLRVIDFLFTDGKSTTGEIARGVNMDMREIRETVEALEEIGLVEQIQDNSTTYWEPMMDELRISLRNDFGLEIEFDLDSPELQNSDVARTTSDPAFNLFTRIGAKIDELVDVFSPFR